MEKKNELYLLKTINEINGEIRLARSARKKSNI